MRESLQGAVAAHAATTPSDCASRVCRHGDIESTRVRDHRAEHDKAPAVLAELGVLFVDGVATVARGAGEVPSDDRRSSGHAAFDPTGRP